jgi:3-polyprenyl-4-hydroxybenzoate decarboxylase
MQTVKESHNLLTIKEENVQPPNNISEFMSITERIKKIALQYNNVVNFLNDPQNVEISMNKEIFDKYVKTELNLDKKLDSDITDSDKIAIENKKAEILADI